VWEIKINTYRVLVGKQDGKRVAGRPRSRLEDNIKIDFRETAWDSMDWTYLAQDRDQSWALVNMVTNLWVLHFF
jgi:hypothetical protein